MIGLRSELKYGKLRDNFTSPREVLLFFRIFLLITALPVLVKLLPLPRLMKLLSGRTKGSAGFGDAENYAKRTAKYTDYLLSRDFWIYRKTCLKRSLVLYHFLRPAIRDLGICFGVRTRKEFPRDKCRMLEGHAWLTREGEIFLEDNPDLTGKFTVTFRFPEDLAPSGDSDKDFAHLSDESRLLLYCSRACISDNEAMKINALLLRPMNWKFISETARSHKVSQLLYRNLTDLSNNPLVPADVMQELTTTYHETIAKNMYIYAELRIILTAFRQMGLEAIVLKGAALAGVVYPDIGLRPMADIDLLVREKDLTAADRVMTGLEYSAIHSMGSLQWYRDNHFHLPPYRHIRKPVIVEIHWHFTAGSPATDVLGWWNRAVSKDLMGYRILVPSTEDMLVHLTVHLFNHGYRDGFVLRCLCDIFELLRQYEIDWELLRKEARQHCMEKQVHSILLMTRKFYAPQSETIIPADLDHADNHFLKVLENGLFMDDGSAQVNRHLMTSMMLGNLAGKARYLLPRIFLSRQEMSRRYHASPFSLAIFLYYLVRPFQLLARYGKPAARIYRQERNGKK